MCGGRHGKRDIARHLLLLEGSILSVVLDASEENAASHLSVSINPRIPYIYIHLPGLSMYERILHASDYIARFKYVCMVAVDDMILDDAILHILKMRHNSEIAVDRPRLVIGFGPSINYVPRTSNRRGYLFSPPYLSVLNGESLLPYQYWQSLKHMLSHADSHQRLMGMIACVGAYPFVYSIYSSVEFLKLTKVHAQSAVQASIGISTARSYVLHEYLTIALAALLSPITVSTSLFRLVNHDPLSEGATADYDHRTCLSSISECNSDYVYFATASQLCSDAFGINQSILTLLYSGYLCLAVTSLHKLQGAAQNVQHLRRNTPYQRHSLQDLLSSCQSYHALNVLRSLVS